MTQGTQPLIQNICHALECLKYNEPLMQIFLDCEHNTIAPYFKFKANRGRIVFEEGIPCEVEYNVELFYHFDMPEDCKFICITEKGKAELASNQLAPYFKRLFDLVFFLAAEENSNSKHYRGRDKTGAGFRFPDNQASIEWNTNTDMAGATGNKTWSVSTSFRIRADYDYCCRPKFEDVK